MLYLVVIAGGKGSRLKKLYKKKSKTLAKINDIVPLRQIYNNFSNIKKKILIINKKQNDIVHFVKNNKLDFQIIKEDQYLGDGGCLSQLQNIKKFYKYKFLIVPGDLIVNLDFSKFYNFHLKKKASITIFTHPTNHLIDSDTVKLNNFSKVIKFYFKPHLKLNTISNISLSGISIINGSEIKKIKRKRSRFNLILKKSQNIFGYNSRELVKDVGTIPRLLHARKFYNLKNIKKFNINEKMPAVFLDRDGVLNKESNNVNYSNPINLFKNVAQSIKKINENHYLSVVITNQPGIAKGFFSLKHLNLSHLRMQNLLSLKGAIIDRIYFCPHYPYKGFKNEVKKFKIKCDCRKPNIGLFQRAIKDLNIDIKKSIFVGNSVVDYLASKNLKIKYYHIKNRISLKLPWVFNNTDDAIFYFFKKKLI